MPTYIKNILCLFIIIIVSTSFRNSLGQDNPTYDFLNIDPSSRASALGGAFETYTDDPNVVFFNPAGISTVTKKETSACFGKYLLDINFGAVSYAQKYKDLGWFGAGVKYINYGTFDYTDENGVTNGTFSANDIMVSAGYSNYMYDVINYGVNIKYIYSTIASYNSLALAFDFGMLYMVPNQDLNIALSINNVGQQVYSYASTRERLPLDVRIGVSKKLEHLPLRLSLSFSNLNNSQIKFLDIQRLKYFSIGGEFYPSDEVTARIGYNNQERQDLKTGDYIGIAGFSAGLGIKFFGKYEVDYSLNSMGKIGSTHRFNIGLAFD